jgi:hypothetical protein
MHAARNSRHIFRTGVLPAHERRAAVELLVAIVAVIGLFAVAPVLLRGPESFPAMLFPLLWVAGSIGLAVRAVRHLARAWRRSRMTDRVSHGRCDRCGYDLTNLRSRRCPECGTYVHRMMLPLAPKEHGGHSPTPRH